MTLEFAFTRRRFRLHVSMRFAFFIGLRIAKRKDKHAYAALKGCAKIVRKELKAYAKQNGGLEILSVSSAEFRFKILIKRPLYSE